MIPFSKAGGSASFLAGVLMEGAGCVTGFWTEASFAVGSDLLTMSEFSGFLFVVSEAL
jgi:hypothetical protein